MLLPSCPLPPAPAQENDQKGIQNKNGALFVLLTNTSFGNIFAVVNVFCSELPVFRREHFNGLYRTDVYFLAKQVELTIQCYQHYLVEKELSGSKVVKA